MIYYCLQISPADRPEVEALFRREWGDTYMVSRGRRHHVGDLDGWLARDEDAAIVGVLTCWFEADEMEIVSIDSLHEGRGIGTALVNVALTEARARGLRRVWLVTTNDNLPALHFWQRRGFDLVALHHDAVAEARRLKPAIPQSGHAGIPIRHELELAIGL